MNWQDRAANSPYLTAVAVREELASGHLAEATEGLEELIDALARSEKRALRSQLIRLMAQILKWKAQPERRSRSWSATIDNARDEIAEIREETPILGDPAILDQWSKCFAAARRQAEGEMDLPCPIDRLSWSEVFDEPYGDAS